MPVDEISFYVIIISLTFAIVAIVFILILLRYSNIKMRRQAEILMASYQAQESERTRIAEDLHDDVGPRLSALKLTVELLKNQMDESQKLEIIKDTSANLDYVIKDIRSIVRNLSSKYIAEKGVYAHLFEMKKQFETSTKFKINMHIEPLNEGFNKEFEINLSRILQELLNNSVKHSDGTEILIVVKKVNEFLEITFSDNGIGYDKNKINKGLGLSNIQTRAKMFKGLLDFDTAHDKGFECNIRFPLSQLDLN